MTFRRFVLFGFSIRLGDNQGFYCYSLEQHWRPPWLSLELTMPPKNKAPKPSADRPKPSKEATIAAAETATRDGAAAAATVEPPTSQAAGDKTVPPLSREEMLERIFLNVPIDQDGNEVPEEDKDSEITEQARDLRKLDQYQQDIIRL